MCVDLDLRMARGIPGAPRHPPHTPPRIPAARTAAAYQYTAAGTTTHRAGHANCYWRTSQFEIGAPREQLLNNRVTDLVLKERFSYP